ncbi:hypothetical protein AMAG_09469 [Allomyces macrogynus ATCC 38327]|uniref:Uncharacterized protein n=1 Tax=Allomyces macrogynus (strain ATCC 38327) TaxID=578462 RepID=A0A0L0SPL3_ALLM3|nr:hypothetical protein AMAG_09469 [Allomyces macrogynus ATCC 38327]|eukprot:KNE64448.1 hypothetical protein AMAG_09469 [Allomyces macrogynus ATCC 38327]
MPTAVALTPSPSGLLADAFASSTTASAALHALVPALSRPAPPPPADTAKVQQLASLLKSDLLKSGELGQIRAHLSARAFQLLSTQRADAPAAQQRHDPAVLGLIAEYLAFYGLEHSLHILLLETTTDRSALPTRARLESILFASAPTPPNRASALLAQLPALLAPASRPAPIAALPSTSETRPATATPFTTVTRSVTPASPAPAAVFTPEPATPSATPAAPTPAIPSAAAAPAPAPSTGTSPPPAPAPLRPVAAPLVQRLPPMTPSPAASSADPAPLRTVAPRADTLSDVSEFSTSLSTRAPAATAPRATEPPSASAFTAPLSRSSAPTQSAAPSSLAALAAAVSQSASSVADECDTSIGSASASFSLSRTRGDTTDDYDNSLDTSDYSLSTASSVSSLGSGRRHGAVQPRRSRRFKGLKLPDVDAYLLHKDTVLDL